MRFSRESSSMKYEERKTLYQRIPEVARSVHRRAFHQAFLLRAAGKGGVSIPGIEFFPKPSPWPRFVHGGMPHSAGQLDIAKGLPMSMRTSTVWVSFSASTPYSPC